jgi:3-hydroxyacyl-CoA dehydrogenase / 3-hydroxy-2-methylbutyryl-CoA dehydrogenase
MEIKGKVAVVTGGASGIGRGACEAFVARGGKVAILDMNEETGQATVAALGAGNALFAKTDVADEAQVSAAIDATVAKFGAIHIVVNAAGVPHAAKTVDDDGNAFPLKVWNKVIGINLTGTFNVLRLAAAKMIRNAPDGESGERGVIINISSGAATQGQAGQAAYSASKAGVVGMVLPVARDLAKHGIRVMAVAPGLFDTPMLAGVPDKVRDALMRIPLFPKRMGQSREIGAALCAIVEIPYFNAETIALDGGARMT